MTIRRQQQCVIVHSNLDVAGWPQITKDFSTRTSVHVTVQVSLGLCILYRICVLWNSATLLNMKSMSCHVCAKQDELSSENQFEQETQKVAVYSIKFDGGEITKQTPHHECPLIGGHPTSKPPPIESLIRSTIGIHLLANAYQKIEKCDEIGPLLVCSLNFCHTIQNRSHLNEVSYRLPHLQTLTCPIPRKLTLFARNYPLTSSSKLSAACSIRSAAGLCTMDILLRESG